MHTPLLKSSMINRIPENTSDVITYPRPNRRWIMLPNRPWMFIHCWIMGAKVLLIANLLFMNEVYPFSFPKDFYCLCEKYQTSNGWNIYHGTRCIIQYVPINMHTVYLIFCFVWVRYRPLLPISFRLTSLVLGNPTINQCRLYIYSMLSIK